MSWPHALVAVDDLVVEYKTSHHTVRPLDGFAMHVTSGSLVALLGPCLLYTSPSPRDS